MKSNTVFIRIVGGNAAIAYAPDHFKVIIYGYDGVANGSCVEKIKHTHITKDRFESCYTQLIKEGQLLIKEFCRDMCSVFPYWAFDVRDSRLFHGINIEGTQCQWLLSSDGLELIHSDGEQIKLDCLEKHEVIDFADSLLLDWDQLLKELKIYGDEIKSRTANKA